MTPNKYLFHEDPAHGWLQVPLAEIKRLNITPSHCSYRDTSYAYLEEDADAALWLRAKDRAGEPHKIEFTRTNGNSFIRRLPRF